MRHRKSLTLLALFALAALSLPATAAAQGNLVCFSPNHTIQASFNGTYIRWEDNTFNDDGQVTDWNFNPYGSSTLTFFFNGAANGGVASSTSGGTWLVLGPGDVIDGSLTFNPGIAQPTAWNVGVDGYLGFRFACSSAGTCYGWAHITTTGPAGHPATILDYCFDSAGDAITIPGASTFVCNAPAEGFEDGVPPTGWTVETAEPSGPQWTTIALSGEEGNYTNGSGEAATVSSDRFDGAEFDTSLVTPAFDLTGFTTASVEYTANYQNLANYDYLDVDISTDGGATWTTLLSWNNDYGAFRAQPGEDVSIDLSAYAGQSGLMLRWRYYDPHTGDWNWYAQIDDVGLVCGQSAEEPNIDVSPPSLSETHATPQTTSQTLTIANTGQATLAWGIGEEPASVRPVVEALTVARAGSGGGGATPLPNPVPEAVVVDEGFDNVTALSGWLMGNHSSPLGASDWFQGNPSAFTAYDGAANAYIAANFQNADDGGDIDNWLVTPLINFSAWASLSFYTRTATNSQWADRLEVRVCTTGACTNFGSGYGQVGDFTTVLLTVNESLNPTGYPQTWTQFTSALPASGSGRVAFRYFVPDNSTNSNYIGIDRVVIDDGSAVACANPADVPWLSASPTSGTTAAGTSTPVTVTFDSTGLAAGTYNANLCVTSNDPNPGPGNGTNLVVVPVSLTVSGPAMHTVTASVGTPAGTIMPPSQTVAHGATATFTLTPDSGYAIDTVGGTCPAGSLAGNVYTTGPITADCEVVANFRQLTYTVTSSVGMPAGTIAPPSQTVAHGATATFTLTPDSGFEIDGVGGTCPAGSLAGNVYTTGAITADCEVVANFRPEAGPGPSVLEIPTLGPAGGALLGLLLAGLGLGTLRRRRA